MDTVTPPEIWSQIVYHACTDDGQTARALSATCSYLRALVTPVRFRSLALTSTARALAFLPIIERSPCLVEHLYLSLDTVQSDNIDAALADRLRSIYKPGCDPRLVHPESLDDIADDNAELHVHLVFRILNSVAPTLRLLSLHYNGSDRFFALPPMRLPLLEEIVVTGYYSDCNQVQLAALPSISRLRRIRLQVSSSPETTLCHIAAYAPNLTHLRLDYSSVDSTQKIDALKNVLHPSSSLGSRPQLPALEKLLIHPGIQPGPFFCGTGLLYQMKVENELEAIAKSDQRVLVFTRYPRVQRYQSPFSSPTILTEWLDRINDRPAYWAEVDLKYPSNHDVL